jgi:hypothetical protein
VTIEITDADGNVIRTFKGPAKLGVNRAVWDLRYDGFKRPPREEASFFFQPRGPEVLPGTYGVRVKYGEHEAEGTVRVLADPRFDIPREEREAKLAAIMRAGALQETVAEAVERIDDAEAGIEDVLERLKKDRGTEGAAEADGELVEAGRRLKRTLAGLEKRFRVPPGTKGIVADTTVYSRVRYVLRSLGSSWDAPTPTQEIYLQQAESALKEALAEFNRVFAEDVAAFRERVAAAGIEFIGKHEPLELPER